MTIATATLADATKLVNDQITRLQNTEGSTELVPCLQAIARVIELMQTTDTDNAATLDDHETRIVTLEGA